MCDGGKELKKGWRETKQDQLYLFCDAVWAHPFLPHAGHHFNDLLEF